MTRPRYVPQDAVEEAISNLQRTSVILAGISAYDHLPELQGPSADMEMMHSLFLEDDISLYDPSRVIELENPTADNFRSTIVNFAQGRSARGDILVLYFTGHGCALGPGGFGFCLKDTKLGFSGNGVLPLSVVSLEDVIGTLTSYDVYPVFILDACFSSVTAPQGSDQFAESVNSELRDVNAESYALLASSSSISPSLDTADGGPFTAILYSIVRAGLPGGTGRHSPFITLDQLASPLQQELSIQGLPLSRCHVGRTLPPLPIARNIAFRPQTERFTPYMRRIVEMLWNSGSPQDVKVGDLARAIGQGAYGNHSKLSYTPWALLEDAGSNRIRRLTARGRKFAQRKLRIPRAIVKDPVRADWRPVDPQDLVYIHDIT
jgi:hypothetical protein